ncbi:N-acetyltransferase [Streptomyces sp. NPDC045251]|uniref:N-acetyltransferase n=1 Tax=unclassified Streptomyces TaxID=2593676 RepID=UPI0033D0F2D3
MFQSIAGTGLRIANLADHPELGTALLTMESTWPAYIRPDPTLVHWIFDRHPRHQLVVLDETDTVVARAASAPLAWDEDPDSLPDTGWDEALRQCMSDTYAGHRLNALCALEIAVVPGRQASRLSGRTLQALKDHARVNGFGDLVAPVRPSLKHTEPRLTMAAYAARTRPDGLPQDPWLRVHARTGGRVLKVCPASMTISGSLAQWRAWTDLPFDTSGPVEVPGALAPVLADVEQGHAVYIEPNVWVHHGLRQPAAVGA